MEKKVNTEVLVKDFENWLDKYMQSWPDNEIHECADNCSFVMDDDRELCKFLDEYPQYNIDIIDNNRDELEVAVMRIAMSNDKEWYYD